MKQKSEVYVLDVLMKNEACHAWCDYLGADFPVVGRYAILGKFNLHAAWEQDFHLECGKKELPALLGCSELGIVGPDEITCSWFHTHGGLGRNIPCDLHNEHVNKLLKDIIINMGPNLTDKALHRSAKSVSILGTIAAQFDLQSGVPVGTSAHSTSSDEADVSRVVSVVQSNSLLTVNIGWIHIAFPKIKLDPLAKLDRKKFTTWIDEKKKQTIKRRALTEEDLSDEYGTDEGDESDDEGSDN